MRPSGASSSSSSSSSAPAAAPARDADSAGVRAAIARLPGSPGRRTAFPLGAATGGEHCYSELDATSFMVRGPDYLEDRVKVNSGEALFDLMHVEMFRSNARIGNVAARRDSWLRAARAAGDARFYTVVVYVTPAPPFLYLIFYFAVQPSRLRANLAFAALWRQFSAPGPEGDAFRNERWKVVPRVAEGSWIVQNAVGSKPALLGQKLAHTWTLCEGPPEPLAAAAAAGAAAAGGAAGGKGAGGGGGAGGSSGSSSGSGGSGSGSGSSGSGWSGAGSGAGGDGAGSVGVADNIGCDSFPQARPRVNSFSTSKGPGPYLESDCDVASSSMAFVLVSLLQSYAKYLVIDLAFTIEPRESDTLPESVLGCIRLSRIDADKQPMIDAEPADWQLGTSEPFGSAAGGNGGASVAPAPTE